MANQWTTKTPTAPGFYWFWVGEDFRRVAEITVDQGKAELWRAGIEDSISPNDQTYFPLGTQWKGPLSPEE